MHLLCVQMVRRVKQLFDANELVEDGGEGGRGKCQSKTWQSKRANCKVPEFSKLKGKSANKVDSCAICQSPKERKSQLLREPLVKSAQERLKMPLKD